MFSALAEGHGTNLNDKINLFIAMAPTVYMSNVSDTFYKGVAELSEILYDSFQLAHVYEIFGQKWHEYAPIVCLFAKDFCNKETVNGIPISEYVNEYRARVKNARESPGTAIKALLHFTELIKTNQFQ